MASFIVRCPRCRTELEVDESLIGSEVACPGCNAGFTVEVPVAQEKEPFPPGPSVPAPGSSGTMISVNCPNCGKVMSITPEWFGTMIECPFCGQECTIPAPTSAPTPAPMSASMRRPALRAALPPALLQGYRGSNRPPSWPRLVVSSPRRSRSGPLTEVPPIIEKIN